MKRGKLTIFLGAVAGVGKTSAMLETARERIPEGLDIIVAWINTHGQHDTKALLNGFEVMPPRKLVSQGRIKREMDLDAVLRKQPQLVLVDDLAHINMEGSRHQHRYLDVEELLESGIDVYATLSIQQLESLNGSLARITGFHAVATVPDRIVDNADQIKMIDIPADELIRRFEDGRVFVPELHETGQKNLFQPANINALREYAFRYAARRVGKQMEEERQQGGITETWPVQERVMACISSSPFSVYVLRRARQIANDTNAELLVVHIEPPFTPQSDRDQARLGRNLQLAEDLGAKVVTLTSKDVSSGILNLAQQYNVSQIILGKPLQPTWRSFLRRRSVVDEIISKCAGIGVYVIPGEPSLKDPTIEASENFGQQENWGWSLAASFFLVALVTLFGKAYGAQLGLVNIGMLYLLPVVYASVRLGAAPSIIIALTSAFSFDIFFNPVLLHLSVFNMGYLITVIVFIVVAITTGSMADRLRSRMREAVHRETRTRALYDLARGLSAVADMKVLATEVVHHVSETVDAEVILFLPEDNQLEIAAASKAFSDLMLGPNEWAAARWSFHHAQRSGIGTETLIAARGFYIPVKTDEKTLDVLAVNPIKRLLSPEQINLLEALAGLAALAIGRLSLAAKAQQVKTLEESERLRAALFNSISHDMKTPLASILGGVSSLVDDRDRYDPDQQMSLLKSVQNGALRMNRLVGNLLDMARLESGYMKLNTEWCDIQDIIGVTLRENQDLLTDHQVTVEIPEAIGLVKADYGLMEQVLANLIHNAVKFSPDQSQISIRVTEEPGELMVAVADHGSGIPPADEERIFDKFYRIQSPGNASGTGLGLSICRGIVEAHGGKIWAKNREDGGSILYFTLPIQERAPHTGEPLQQGGLIHNER